MPCGGDAATICGGPNRLSLYGASASPPAYTQHPHPGGPVNATQYEGCWTEVTAVTGGRRALSGAGDYSASAMTVAGCGAFCLDAGFAWFGLEYAAECYCGSGLDANSTRAAETDCAMPCSGAAGEVCGGPDRLSVYQWV